MKTVALKKLGLSSLYVLFVTLFCVSAMNNKSFAGPGNGKGSWDHRVPYIPKNDVQFIDALGPHHEMAVEMAHEVLKRGAHHDVKKMAKEMKESQLHDIEEMRHARKELTGDSHFKPMHDPHAEHDLHELRSLSGHELDEAFLRHMIPHHGAGLSIVHRAFPHLERHDLKEIAKKNFHDQAKEIGEMIEMLERIED